MYLCFGYSFFNNLLYNGIQDSIDRQCYMAGNIKLNGFKNPSYVFDKTKELLKDENMILFMLYLFMSILGV